MLQYEKVDISEGIDTNKCIKKCIKRSASNKCIKRMYALSYWYFKDVGFRFQSHVCNKCHDVLMTAYKLKNIAILNVKGVDFRCILWGISRDELVGILC